MRNLAGWRSRPVFGRWLARISAGTEAILPEGFSGFPQYLQENTGIVP
jgi:hypothetical protein